MLALYHVFEVTEEGIQPEIITRPGYNNLQVIDYNKRLRTYKSLIQARAYKNRLAKENRTARIYQVNFFDNHVSGSIVE